MVTFRLFPEPCVQSMRLRQIQKKLEPSPDSLRYQALAGMSITTAMRRLFWTLGIMQLRRRWD